MLHQGAESAGVDGPVMDSLVFVELGMDRNLSFEGQLMGCGDSLVQSQIQVPIVTIAGGVPFLQKIFALKRLFFPGPSSIATSHLSTVVTLSRSLVGSPPVRVRKTESRACHED